MKKILKAQVSPNCFIFTSCQWRSKDQRHDEYNMRTIMSFAYIDNEKGIAAEWCPTQTGPIEIVYRSTEEDGKEHYIFDYIEDTQGSWSQLAVSRNDLPGLFVSGRYEQIFDVLKQWTQYR